MIAVTAAQAVQSFTSILDAVEQGETVLITRDGVPIGRLVPERRTSADRLQAALRDSPADAGFADDLERAHDDLRSAFDDELRGWSSQLFSTASRGARGSFRVQLLWRLHGLLARTWFSLPPERTQQVARQLLGILTRQPQHLS
jgi:prevent-host-death family protein